MALAWPQEVIPDDILKCKNTLALQVKNYHYDHFELVA